MQLLLLLTLIFIVTYIRSFRDFIAPTSFMFHKKLSLILASYFLLFGCVLL
jgi:hypothetical protein